MTELITSHAYERGPYGRCGHGSPPCNKRKAAHGEMIGVGQRTLATITGARFVPRDEGEIEAQVERASTALDAFRSEASWGIGGLPVYLVGKRALGELGEEIRLDWPSAWPLPRIGESVKAGGAGRVRGIQFDLDRGRIILYCD